MLIRSESKRTNEKCNATKKCALKIIWPEPRARPVWVCFAYRRRTGNWQRRDACMRMINAMRLFRHSRTHRRNFHSSPKVPAFIIKILLLIKRTRFRSLSLTSCRSFRFSLGIYSFSFPSSVATDLLSVLFRLSIRVFALISFTLSHNFVLNIRKLSANWFSLHTFRVVVVVWSLCVLLDVISLSSVRHRSSISHERSTSQVAQRDSFFWYLRACIPRWALTRPISAAAWAARAHRDSVKIELIDGEESEKHFDQIWQIRFVSAVRQPSAITRLERPFNKNNWTKSIEVDYCVISIE